MSAAERRALILLLSLGLVGPGRPLVAHPPGEAPGEVQLLAALPPRSPAAHRDSILALRPPPRPRPSGSMPTGPPPPSWPGCPGSVSRSPRRSWRIARPGVRSGGRPAWTGCPASAPDCWPPSARTLPSPDPPSPAAPLPITPTPAGRSGRSFRARTAGGPERRRCRVVGRPAGSRTGPGPGHRELQGGQRPVPCCARFGSGTRYRSGCPGSAAGPRAGGASMTRRLPPAPAAGTPDHPQIRTQRDHGDRSGRRQRPARRNPPARWPPLARAARTGARGAEGHRSTAWATSWSSWASSPSSRSPRSSRASTGCRRWTCRGSRSIPRSSSWSRPTWPRRAWCSRSSARAARSPSPWPTRATSACSKTSSSSPGSISSRSSPASTPCATLIEKHYQRQRPAGARRTSSRTWRRPARTSRSSRSRKRRPPPRRRSRTRRWSS